MHDPACRFPATLFVVVFGSIATSGAASADGDPNALTVLVSRLETHEPTQGPANQSFGAQVAVSSDGNTLAVSDPWFFGGGEWPWYGSGAVYVYSRSNGAWTLQAKLEPTNARGYDFFGCDVALSADGNTLAIGAQFEGGDDPEEGGGEGFGSVFVFTRTGGVWAQDAYLRSPNPQHSASFGRTVELSAPGTVLAAGAPYESVSGEGSTSLEAGGAYVFERAQNGWRLQAGLHARVPQAYDRFGVALRLSDDGETIAVLAGEQNQETEDLEAGGWHGRNNTLHVFGRARAGWSLQTTIEGAPTEPLFAGNGYDQEGQNEGFDLSGDGDTLAVGSPFGAGPDGESGHVRLYRRTAGAWIKSSEALTPPLDRRLQFGLRVTLSESGSTLAASADRDDGPYGRPFVVVFEEGAAGWSQSAVLETSAWPDYTSFGNALSLSRTGERLVVGARAYPTETTYWGAAFIYR